jgi:hypothetical protein
MQINNHGYPELYEEQKSKSKQATEEPKLIIRETLSIILILLMLLIIESFLLIQLVLFTALASTFGLHASALLTFVLMFLVIMICGFAFHGIAHLLIRYQKRWFSKLSFALKYMTITSLFLFWIYRFWFSMDRVLLIILMILMVCLLIFIQYVISKHHRINQWIRTHFFLNVILFTLCALSIISLSFMI